ncbi:MFS transporter [Spirillospora sp. NPDC029432]|uniref:MFS transporter n=1 Tax=Spirillospora sp. NPDC029432 TaxID=3154599 RepID=UPI0034517D48
MGSSRATLPVLMAGCGTFAMLQSLVLPILPTIQARMHTSQSTVTWVMTAHLLSAAICTPIAGRVGDAVGKKRALVAVLLALAVGCAVAALASGIGVLILARVIQGVAGAVFPLSYGIIRDRFPAGRVASGVGAISAVIAAGGGLGLVAAGPIVDALDYRWLFWIPLVLAAASALAAYRLVPESPRRDDRIAWPAALPLSAWLTALLLAVSKGPQWGWLSPAVLGLLTAAVATAAAWVATELGSSRPLIDMRMMRLPQVWTTNLAALFFGAGQFAMFTFLPQFVQTAPAAGYGFGSTVSESGVLLLPMLVAMFLGGAVSGPVERRFRSKAQLVTGSVLGTLAFAGLALAHDQRWTVIAAATVFGAGLGLGLSAMTNLVVGGVPAAQTGAAGGMNANIRTIGGAIGAALTGSVVTAGLRSDGAPLEAGYTAGFLLLAVVSAAAAAAALAIPPAR